MTDKEYFYSIEQQRTATIKIKRSVFICTLKNVESIEAAKQFISRISKENRSANHNCWAYIVGKKGNIFHCSDAGEPAGTAGKPMLNTLQSHHMSNIAAVVTRHFGGVKLGIRGLMDAYSDSVKSVIDLAKLKKQVQTVYLDIEVSYDFNDTLIRQLKTDTVTFQGSVYSEKIVHTIEMERKEFISLEKRLLEYQSQGWLQFHILGDEPG